MNSCYFEAHVLTNADMKSVHDNQSLKFSSGHIHLLSRRTSLDLVIAGHLTIVIKYIWRFQLKSKAQLS